MTGLVEWPVVLEAGFEAEFLRVPQECLILTMQQNQKYFPLLDASGKLMNRFLLVSNLETADPSFIVGGNERVLRARQSDASSSSSKTRRRGWTAACRVWPMWSTTIRSVRSWARRAPAEHRRRHRP